jgi:hypothetical protein
MIPEIVYIPEIVPDFVYLKGKTRQNQNRGGIFYFKTLRVLSNFYNLGFNLRFFDDATRNQNSRTNVCSG